MSWSNVRTYQALQLGSSNLQLGPVGSAEDAKTTGGAVGVVNERPYHVGEVGGGGWMLVPMRSCRPAVRDRMAKVSAATEAGVSSELQMRAAPPAEFSGGVLRAGDMGTMTEPGEDPELDQVAVTDNPVSKMLRVGQALTW